VPDGTSPPTLPAIQVTMQPRTFLQNALIGVTATLLVAARFVPGTGTPGPVVAAAAELVRAPSIVTGARGPVGTDAVATETASALEALSGAVGRLSHPQALEDAFRSYFAYKAAHPGEVKKPYLYFVDYGQPSTAARGYVFDMETHAIVDGPFTVAHGRGSSTSQYGVPTRFANASGSAATSLGLYVAQELYAFRGKSGGHPYSSIGLRLMGVSHGYNDNARARGVVAHGAPYVTATRAGRSEGCPAVEPERAERLLPKLANGGMVFLFAPNTSWLAGDPWLTASNG
jgi:hypothetical protein